MISLMLLFVACGPEPAVVAQGLGSGNPAVRGDMLDLARSVEDPLVVQALLASLQDPSQDLRLRALEALAEQGDALAEQEEASVAPQVAELLQDPSLDIQRAAAETLGRLGDPAGAQPLVDWLSGQEQPVLNGIWALGQPGDPVALPLLAQLQLSSDPYVSYNATAALRELGDQPAPEQPMIMPGDEEQPVEVQPPEPDQPVEPAASDKQAPPTSQRVAWPPG